MADASLLPLTPSQTVGPFFAIGLQHLCVDHVPQPARVSSLPSIEVEGRILDAEGVPVPDAFLEIWQADATGCYSTEGEVFDLVNGLSSGRTLFPGFARVSTEPEGSFRFTTVQPGSVPYDASRMQAPHLLVFVFMRGLLRHLVTRMYFPDPATGSDPVLQSVPAPRRPTLIASEIEPDRLHWDIRLRGDDETVFFLC